MTIDWSRKTYSVKWSSINDTWLQLDLSLTVNRKQEAKTWSSWIAFPYPRLSVTKPSNEKFLQFMLQHYELNTLTDSHLYIFQSINVLLIVRHRDTISFFNTSPIHTVMEMKSFMFVSVILMNDGNLPWLVLFHFTFN